MKLTDQTIYTFLHLLQVAMLTGTDIIDHFRMIDLDCDENQMINLTDASQKLLEENIKKMLDESKELLKDDSHNQN
jgi:riboflavin synthase